MLTLRRKPKNQLHLRILLKKLIYVFLYGPSSLNDVLQLPKRSYFAEIVKFPLLRIGGALYYP